MAVTTVIKLTHPAASEVKVWPSYQPREQAVELSNLFATLASGKPAGSMDVSFAGTAGTKATATLLCGETITGDLTVTINGVEIEAAAGATPAAAATALLAAIKAETDPLVADLVVATKPTTTTVALEAKQRGLAGNAFTIAVTGTGLTVQDSATRFVGGAGDDVAAVTYSYT